MHVFLLKTERGSYWIAKKVIPEKQSQLGSILQSQSVGAPAMMEISPLVVTCWMRFTFLSSVSAMKSSPLWETLMALADSRVEWIATLLTKKWSMPGTWQWMGRPAMIRTRLFSEIWSTMLLSKTYNELSKGLTARSVGHSNRTCKKNRTHTIRLQYLSGAVLPWKKNWLIGSPSHEFQQCWCYPAKFGRTVDWVLW